MTCIPVELSYEEHGQGTPLVLLHGYPLDRTIWQPVLPYLVDSARVILPDLRGYGKSPVTDGVYSMRLMAEDVAALLDRLGIEKAIIVGHSMGGYVALAFAKAYPNRLLALGLIASRAGADNPEKRQSRLVSARNIRRKGIASLAKRMPMQLTADEDLADKLIDLISNTDPIAAAASLKGMAEREDATDWLASIDVPTVVVAGQNDAIIPIDDPETYVNFFPRAWFVPVPGSGHMPMMEAPEIVADAIKQLVHHANGFGKNGQD